MDDVSADAPDQHRPSLGAGRRWLLVTAAVLAAAVAVVAISRAGLEDDAAPAGAAPTTPATVPLDGELLQLAAGQDLLYALVQDCTAPDRCAVALLSSATEGRTWRRVALPAGTRPSLATARAWRLEVSGSEDQLSIEDAAAGVVHLGTTSFTTRKITDGGPVGRVPANRETLTRLCPRSRCATPTVEFLEPRTGERSPLAHQPPFPPTALAVEGAQLWVAGVDPVTRAYAVALSTDDGDRWWTVPAVAREQPGTVPRLVPVPEENLAYLVLGPPGADGLDSVYGVWAVSDPRTGTAPRGFDPAPDLPGLPAAAVGRRDGGLVAGPFVLEPGGRVDRLEIKDPDGDLPPVPYRALQRGPHALLVAIAPPDAGAAIVVSATGDPNDWQLRPLKLPL